jgi:hypothetical protein
MSLKKGDGLRANGPDKSDEMNHTVQDEYSEDNIFHALEINILYLFNANPSDTTSLTSFIAY